jgi:LacI family transcriptional regulator
MRKQATIDDVAARAGLSIKTVSRVFNGEPNVRPQTRDRVLAAAKLLYDDHDPASDYVIDIQDGALAVCRGVGYHLLIQPCRTETPNLVDGVIGLYRRSTVDGLILTQPLSDHDPLVTALLEAEMAFVRVSQRPCEGPCHCISVDDEQAARRMTDHLISLGHRRIGFVTGHPDHGSSHDRLAGFRSSLEAHDIPLDSAPVEQGRYTFESGRACGHRLLAGQPCPTAIFASNDHMAMGVITAARERELDVPADLSVSGFDDAPMARYAWPPLTTVRQPVKLVARVATECLIHGLTGTGERPTRHVLESEVVIRESTAQCAQ